MIHTSLCLYFFESIGDEQYYNVIGVGCSCQSAHQEKTHCQLPLKHMTLFVNSCDKHYTLRTKFSRTQSDQTRSSIRYGATSLGGTLCNTHNPTLSRKTTQTWGLKKEQTVTMLATCRANIFWLVADSPPDTTIGLTFQKTQTRHMQLRLHLSKYIWNAVCWGL